MVDSDDDSEDDVLDWPEVVVTVVNVEDTIVLLGELDVVEVSSGTASSCIAADRHSVGPS